MITFKDLMDEETTRARSRGGHIKSWHEAYGLIKEEFEEFWDEVRKRPGKRDRENALRELAQVAALCERAAIDLALLDDHQKNLNKTA